MQILKDSKNLNMRFAFIFFLLLVGLVSFGRQVKRLEPGEVVPRINIKVADQDQVVEKYLDPNLDSLIILDFWATWCTGCVSSIEVLDELQKRFKNRVKILLVNSASTGDDSSKIKAYYQRWNRKKETGLSLSTIIYDSTFSAWFPHSSIPHFVWIYKGKFLAISDKASLSDTIISGLLDDGTFRGKKMSPILFSVNDRLVEVLEKFDSIGYSYSVFSVENENLPSMLNRTWYPPPRYSKVTMLNQTLLTLIKQAYRFWLPNNRIKLRGSDESKRRLVETFDERLSYEMQDTAQSRLHMVRKMAEDIERRFKFKALVTKRKESCIYIRKVQVNKPWVKVDEVDSVSLSTLVFRLNEMSSIPIVQSANISSKQSVYIKSWPRSESEIPAFLKENGIKASRRKRALEVLLIDAK